MWKKALALSFAAFTAAPFAAASDLASRASATDHGLEMCVAEIGKRTKYDDASRVVHRVTEAAQKNLVERRYRINTLLYAGGDQSVLRSYESVCVTRGPLKVVRFDIGVLDGGRYSAAL
jgi:hypothetical protein